MERKMKKNHDTKDDFDNKNIKNLEKEIENGNIGIYEYNLFKKNIKIEKENFEINNKDCIIKHKIDNDFGQSGSGIILKKNNNFYIIGIHDSIFAKENYNRGTLITKERCEKIKKWILSGFLIFKDKFKEIEINEFDKILIK